MDVLARLYKQAGWEADPEVIAGMRAICDAPVDPTNPHEVIVAWVEKETERLITGRWLGKGAP